MVASTTISVSETSPGESSSDALVPALLLAWSHAEPHRVGELALVEKSVELGREGAPLVRQRPGDNEVTSPLGGPGISRKQLRVLRRGDALAVERIGRCPLLFDGQEVDRAILEPGDVATLRGQAVLLCAARPLRLAPLRELRAEPTPFGQADGLGIVGESPVLWDLREQLAFVARADHHALVLGPTGTGKELAARALHALSRRARGPFVTRNAATIPTGLADAELFGNLKNYPNPGVPERHGLIGEADGGTLFLDELGELPSELQAHLLRVLDSGGEYTRLGEAKARRSDFRLVAATNKDPGELKHDLVPRFPLRVVVPPLSEHRDDIPLLIHHLLERAWRRSPEIVGRFRRGDGGFALSPSLVEELSKAPLTGNVRELDGLLWDAMAQSRGDTIGPPRAVTSAVRPVPRAPPPATPEPTAEQILRALDEHQGNVVRAAAGLGLPSRYALYRLLKKHQLDPTQARKTPA